VKLNNPELVSSKKDVLREEKEKRWMLSMFQALPLVAAGRVKTSEKQIN